MEIRVKTRRGMTSHKDVQRDACQRGKRSKRPHRVIFDRVQWRLHIGRFRFAPRADILLAPTFVGTRP